MKDKVTQRNHATPTEAYSSLDKKCVVNCIRLTKQRTKIFTGIN